MSGVKYDAVLGTLRSNDWEEDRITTLEESNATNWTEFWQSIPSGTSGTITAPTGYRIVLDQWPSGVDAIIEGITNGVPDGTPVYTAGGALVTVTSLGTNGAYVLSGAPAAYPVSFTYAAIATASIEDTPVNGNTTIGISSNWAFDHEADTTTHGTTGAVVGTSDTQTLSNKTLLDYKETRYAVTTAGNVTINLANGNVQRFILDAARQFTMPADPGDYGQSFVLIIECATYTPTWNASPTIEWLTSDGAAPTLVTTANLVNCLTFIWDDTDSRWLGFLAGKETA